jgi:hypothetical protein
MYDVWTDSGLYMFSSKITACCASLLGADTSEKGVDAAPPASLEVSEIATK